MGNSLGIYTRFPETSRPGDIFGRENVARGAGEGRVAERPVEPSRLFFVACRRRRSSTVTLGRGRRRDPEETEHQDETEETPDRRSSSERHRPRPLSRRSRTSSTLGDELVTNERERRVRERLSHSAAPLESATDAPLRASCSDCGAADGAS